MYIILYIYIYIYIYIYTYTIYQYYIPIYLVYIYQPLVGILYLCLHNTEFNCRGAMADLGADIARARNSPVFGFSAHLLIDHESSSRCDVRCDDELQVTNEVSSRQ